MITCTIIVDQIERHKRCERAVALSAERLRAARAAGLTCDHLVAQHARRTERLHRSQQQCRALWGAVEAQRHDASPGPFEAAVRERARRSVGPVDTPRQDHALRQAFEDHAANRRRLALWARLAPVLWGCAWYAAGVLTGVLLCCLGFASLCNTVMP